MTQALLELRDLTRTFPSGDEEVAVLKSIDLTINRGEIVAIVGASGSGKSTLMNILGCLDRPSSGSYRIAGREAAALDNDELARLPPAYVLVGVYPLYVPNLEAERCLVHLAPASRD